YSPGFNPGWARDVADVRMLVGLPTNEVARALERTVKPTPPALGEMRSVVPLYVEQLLRFLREESGRAPTGLADIIAVRVERLAPDARRVLQAAAVWGDDADEQVLARVLGEDIDIGEALGFLRR